MIGTGTGHLAGKALNKYPGQSREHGQRAGALTGAALGMYAAHKNQPNKVIKLMSQGEKLHKLHKGIGLGLADRAKSWGHYAKGVGKAYLPEMAAGAIAAALFARSRGKKKKPEEPEEGAEKVAISKAWFLESKPGRASLGKALSMIEGHRNQIASSEKGLAGSVLARHKKIKQSVGDSMKIAMIPMQPPEPPQVQQSWRGRPPKNKVDTTTVSGSVVDTASKLDPVSTTGSL
jgi:hypothetical protein